MRAGIAIGTALVALAAGCGDEPEPLPPACSDGPESVRVALRAAPGPVRLPGGTRLSDCVARATNDAELQQVGFSLTPVADDLAEAATPESALQLGYLLGAVRQGAARSNGVALELVRRMENTITFDAPALIAAVRRGERAGEAGG